jgi:hypothetical protein
LCHEDQYQQNHAAKSNGFQRKTRQLIDHLQRGLVFGVGLCRQRKTIMFGLDAFRADA